MFVSEADDYWSVSGSLGYSSYGISSYVAPKSHLLISQSLTEQPNIYTQLPLPLQAMSALPENPLSAFRSDSGLDPSTISCCGGGSG